MDARETRDQSDGAVTHASMPIQIRKLADALGAEIAGVDLSANPDAASFAEIERVFNENTVVVFRGQRLSPQQHIDFSQRFGELEVNVMNEYALRAHPEILVISNVVENGRPIGLADAGRNWHTDMSYMPRPPRCSLLYALKVPENHGRPLGDTLFVSTAAAYDALSAAMQEKLASLKAVHRSSARIRNAEQRSEQARQRGNALPDVTHPVVRTHPVAGRMSIYVREGECIRIVGMPDDEALPLIKTLSEFCVRPEFMYRHHWRVGDLVMWDNCTAQHLAVNDYQLPQERLMYRTTVNGTVPF